MRIAPPYRLKYTVFACSVISLILELPLLDSRFEKTLSADVLDKLVQLLREHGCERNQLKRSLNILFCETL